MTSRDFVFWFNGFLEISGPDVEIDKAKLQIIRNHLNLVFKHEIDPSMPDPTGELQAIHDGLQPISHNPPTTTDGPNSAMTLLRC